MWTVKLCVVAVSVTDWNVCRSNAAISQWSSDYFYFGHLRAHKSVANITLRDILPQGNNSRGWEADSPLVLVDTM